jgi:hypothetical protein
VLTACAGAEATAVNVCTDMTTGIIARFRTMAITRTSVLTGQVIGSLIRTMMSGALVVGAAVALGFRPTATPLQWVAAAGIFAILALAPAASSSRRVLGISEAETLSARGALCVWRHYALGNDRGPGQWDELGPAVDADQRVNVGQSVFSHSAVQRRAVPSCVSAR